MGSEGMVGDPVVLGTDRSPSEIFMQVEGEGHSVPAQFFRELLDRSPALLRTFLLFSHVLRVQSSYAAFANAKGKLEERLARWLLMAQDRLLSPHLTLTHEFVALMLGVRRAGVSTAVEHFEAQGLLSDARGMISVLDRDGLVESANGFYGTPEAEYERVFGRSI